MSDESHIHLLDRESFTQYDDRLSKWARSLDTTPEQLKEILRRGGDGAKYVRELIGLKSGD